MEITMVKTVEPSGSYSTAPVGDSSQVKKNAESESSKANSQNNSLPKDKTLKKEDLVDINNALNKFMSVINADIQFEINDRTKQLMVQVVDTKDSKVLREFPSHEMLNVLANIREYVGILLDKKV